MIQKPVYRLLFVVSIAAMASAGADETSDAALYRDTLTWILKFEKPNTFAVWEQQIDAATMEAFRVPRQDPFNQFSRSLKGLNPSLEKTLMTPAGDVDADKLLPQFAMPSPLPVPAMFSGFFGLEEIERAEAEAKPKDYSNWPLLIGFSKVAYGDHGNSALLYAEICSLGPKGPEGPTGGCGGGGYWFAKGQSGWRLKRRASLWDGGSSLLWEVQPATAHAVAK